MPRRDDPKLGTVWLFSKEASSIFQYQPASDNWREAAMCVDNRERYLLQITKSPLAIVFEEDYKSN